jgi:hypothetical protein
MPLFMLTYRDRAILASTELMLAFDRKPEGLSDDDVYDVADNWSLPGWGDECTLEDCKACEIRYRDHLMLTDRLFAHCAPMDD